MHFCSAIDRHYPTLGVPYYRVSRIFMSRKFMSRIFSVPDNVRERGLEQKCFRRWRKVDRDGAEIALSGRLFQMVGPATAKARPPTVDSLTDGTSRKTARRSGLS